MSEQKHTKGPWTTSSVMRARVIACGAIRIADCADKWDSQNDGCGPDFAEQMANARLISAAPELLDACQSMLSYIEMRMAHTGTQAVAEITDSLKRVVPYVAEVSTYHHAGCAATTRTVDLRAVRNAIAKTEGGGG